MLEPWRWPLVQHQQNGLPMAARFHICGYQTLIQLRYAAFESWLMVEFTSVTVFLCT